MPEKFRARERYGEAFWRKHQEAWQQSALNQREYDCGSHVRGRGAESALVMWARGGHV